ncbi:MAG: TOBE domain-containing protein, partial [Planctomycetaceae bacterium]|nr:TOBE domain-containing protein [Planctomycetaceae bacterium]
TIYVTHDQIEAMTMAARIVVMHDGLIEQVGTPLELYDNPANKFVAGFIGSPAMNFVQGTLEGDALVLPTGDRIALGKVPAHEAGRPVTLGIRPEHFQLDPEGLAMQVVTVEPTGSETQVMMRYAGQDLVGVFRERISAKPGEKLHVRPSAERLHFFTGNNGVRLVA